MKYDLHVHTNRSDGIFEPTAVLDLHLHSITILKKFVTVIFHDTEIKSTYLKIFLWLQEKLTVPRPLFIDMHITIVPILIPWPSGQRNNGRKKLIFLL